jgi:hypothetical protein
MDTNEEKPLTASEGASAASKGASAASKGASAETQSQEQITCASLFTDEAVRNKLFLRIVTLFSEFTICFSRKLCSKFFSQLLQMKKEQMLFFQFPDTLPTNVSEGDESDSKVWTLPPDPTNTENLEQ